MIESVLHCLTGKGECCRPGLTSYGLIMIGDSAKSAQNGIMIIGAGLPGLTLALALTKAGIGCFVVKRLRQAYTNRRLYSTLILKEGKYQETLAFRPITFSLNRLAESV